MPQETKESVPVTTNKKGAKEEGAKTEVSVMQPLNEIDRLFDHFFRRGWPSLRRWGDMPMLDKALEWEGARTPNMDVIDRDNEILVRAEIPGIKKEDLNISITGNLLTIKGHCASEAKEEKGDYHKREICNFSFSRSVSLPGAVDTSKTEASLKNGILEITLPKEESSKRRTITVQ